jgi:hypothetical protein
MANLFSATCFGVSFCAVMMLMIVTHLKIKISSRIGYCDFSFASGTLQPDQAIQQRKHVIKKHYTGLSCLLSHA